MSRFWLTCLGISGVALLSAGTAFAHIDLLEPEARAHGTAARGDTAIDDNSNVKSGPCGQMVSGRTTRVATYAPGETLTVRVREENAHVSYLRVRINLDGESFPVRAQVPAAAETQEQAEVAELALGDEGLLAVVREDNDTPGFVHEIEVTLPDATCSNCTLQVIQFMYDDPAAPYYFQCADLVIANAIEVVDAGSGEPDDVTSPEAAGPPNAAGSGSAEAPPEPQQSGTDNPDPSPGPATGDAIAEGTAMSSAPRSGGCGVVPAGFGLSSPLYCALLALGLAVAARLRLLRKDNSSARN